MREDQDVCSWRRGDSLGWDGESGGTGEILRSLCLAETARPRRRLQNGSRQVRASAARIDHYPGRRATRRSKPDACSRTLYMRDDAGADC